MARPRFFLKKISVSCHLLHFPREQEQTLFKDLRRQDIERNNDEAKKK